MPSTPGTLPRSGITRLHSTWLVFRLGRYYSRIRLPKCHLPPLPIRLVGHTRTIMFGCHGSPRNIWASLVALMTAARSGRLSRLCVTRAGDRLRVSVYGSPMTPQTILPSGMHKPWAGSNRYKISELRPFTARRPRPVGSPSLPLCVRFKIRFRNCSLYASCNTRYGACG